MERRTVLAVLLQAGSAVVALVVGIPTLISVLSPAARDRRGPAWRSVGLLEQFPVGEVREGTIQREPQSPELAQTLDRGTECSALATQAVYVWRPSEEEVVVFSRSCTDLGCPVTWDAGSHCFLCPCHGGIFAKNGDRMAGPPDRPLYRYDNRLRDGRIEIDLSSVPPMV